MALSDSSRIDVVSEDPSGEVVLTIVASGPWSRGTRAMTQLTDKLCAYLEYMHSEDYRGKYGSKRAAIQLSTAEEPPDQVKKLLEATAAAADIRIDIQRSPWLRSRPDPGQDAPEVGAGLRSQEVAVPASVGPPEVSSKRVVQSVFGVLGVLGGLGGAVYAFSRSSSFFLAIYVFFLANYVIARGVADVVTDPHKIRRVLYFALMPAACTGILYLVYQQWNRMWLAVVLGFLGGIILNGFLAPLLFPKIHREEEMDSMARVKEVMERHAKG